MKKRGSLDIICTILEASNGGIGKTRLQERANLTSSQFKKYIDLLVAKKLVETNRIQGHPSYTTTELGMKYVDLYGAIKTNLYLSV